MKKLFLIIMVIFLSSCSQDVKREKPEPSALTADAAGHYCQMIILDHDGPKSQAHLLNNGAPLWFSQVRDALAFMKSPDKTFEITVVYVNDVGVAPSWSDMGENNWIDIEKAFFVVGSDALGGMGAPEFVPFADKEKAQEFAKDRGGEVLSFNEIDSKMVLTPIDYEAYPIKQ